MAMVKIKINDREIEVIEGLNLIEAARTVGVEIPHFCYHPGLGVDGNCRMCLVEVEGIPKPQIACNTFVKEGLAFHTDTERVKELQRAVLEFLFLNHPLDCPICDQAGECYLQDYYMSNGRYDSRLDLPKVHKRKVTRIGPRVVLDAERCVLCTRCVRFCDQVTGTGELYIVNRGNRSEITTYPGKPLDNGYSLNTVDVCPVGALTDASFRFRKRVWHLRATASICTGCARGCNIFLEEDEGVIYRYRPRENMEVNRYWMCDYGRTTFQPMNEDRLDVALRGEEMVPITTAIEEVAGWFRGAGDRANDSMVLLSPVSPTETLFAAKQLAREVLHTDRVVGTGTRPPGVEDRILRRADPYPNTAGLELLGLAGDPVSALEAGGGLLVIIDDDPMGQRGELASRLEKFERVVYLGSNECATSRAARLSLPIAPHSECEGTFVNFQGRVQRFRKAIIPRGDALWAPELLRRLAEGAGKPPAWRSPAELWGRLASAEAEFEGIDYARLGDGGVLVSSRRSAHVVPSGIGGGNG